MPTRPSTSPSSPAASARWLLLIHQLPTKPDYLRVKTWRRLQALGAVGIKGSVYALPLNEATREAFHWIAREIADAGGEATICAAQLVEGLTDSAVEALFQAARKADYDRVTEDARALRDSLRAPARKRQEPREIASAAAKLRNRIAAIAEIDFFGAPGRQAAEALLSAIEEYLAKMERATEAAPHPVRPAPRGERWVTRRGIHVDRMASAWLIRRFIDPAARFEFVDPKTYQHDGRALRFDMYDAEFTHEGELCTFEVLMRRFDLKQPALRAIAQMVHDIDLKDARYEWPETAGFERLVAGIALSQTDDERRLARASAVLDDLYTAFDRKPDRLPSATRAAQASSARPGGLARRRRKPAASRTSP